MKIKGLGNLTMGELRTELLNGGRFVIYEYCISVLVASYKRPSAIHFVRSGESRVLKGLAYSLLSFLLGWWGVPMGPVYTVEAITHNFRGGKDVSSDVVDLLTGKPANKSASSTKNTGKNRR
jgi:hypothetical protein